MPSAAIRSPSKTICRSRPAGFAISEADPFIAGIVEVTIDPLAVPAIFQVAFLVGDADRGRPEGADAPPAGVADARIGHAVRAGRPKRFRVDLGSGVGFSVENAGPLAGRQRGDISEFRRDGADENPKILAPGRIRAVPRKCLEMEHGLCDRRLERRSDIVNSEAAVAKAEPFGLTCVKAAIT